MIDRNQRDALLERDILDNRIQTYEQFEILVQKALWETDIKIYQTMKRLLTANDVKKDKGMRENILEQMNDLRRNVEGFFKNAGVELPHASDSNGGEPNSVY
jgi:hypothetical protein